FWPSGTDSETEDPIMLQTAIVRARVTAYNCDDFRDTITARDQRREVKIGDLISHYRSDDFDELEIEVTVWHNLRRAAVCSANGDSEWGDWEEREETITLDEADADGVRTRLDRYGQPLE